LASKPGAGSTFSLILPLARGDASKVEPERTVLREDDFPTRPLPGIEEAQRENSLVLVVDDHATNREVLTRQLARAGFACETAADGEEGLQRWESGAYALILTDIHMPKLDGYQLTAAIRKGEPERCIAMGMDGFLGKPLRIAQLSETLRRWLPHVVFPAGGESMGDTAQPIQPADDALFTPESPVSAVVLGEIAGDDAKLAHNLLNDFLAAARKDHAALVAALDAANLPEAIRQAHRIKGAAALVGAHDVHAAAAAAEAAGRAGGGVALDTATDSLGAAIDLLAVWVER